MPRIPEFSLPQVSATAPNMPAMQAPSVTPMRDFSAEGVQAMTTGLSNVADLMIKTQNHIDDARVRDADSDLADFESQQIGQLRGQKGMSAVKSYSRTIKSFNDKRDEIAKSLDNDIQRQMFQGVSEDRSRRFNSNASEHFIKESRSADIASTSKRIGVRQRDAMLQQPGTPGFADMMNNLDVEVDRLGELNGWDEDILRDEKRKRRSDVYDAHVKRLMTDGDVAKAYQVFNTLDPSKDIEPESYGKLHEGLRKAARGKAEQDITKTIIDLNLPLLDSIKALREAALKPGSQIDAETQNKIETNLRQHDQDRKSAAAERIVTSFAIAQDFLQKNPSASVDDLSRLDPSLYQDLFRAGKLDALESWMQGGHRFANDPAAIRELNELETLPDGGILVKPSRPSIMGPITPEVAEMLDRPALRLPLREMTQAQIRERFEGRVNDAMLKDAVSKAIDAPGNARGQGSSSSSGGGDLFDAELRRTARAIGLLDDKGKLDPNKAAQHDQLVIDANKFRRNQSVVDPKTGIARQPNDAEMAQWFKTYRLPVGKAGGNPVYRADLDAMTPEQVAGIEVEYAGGTMRVADLPTDFVQKMQKELGPTAGPTDYVQAWLVAHEGRTPVQEEKKKRDDAQARANPPQPYEPGPIGRWAASAMALDTARESYEAQRDSTIAGIAAKQTPEGLLRSAVEVAANVARETEVFVAKGLEPLDIPIKAASSAVSRAADAIVSGATGIKDVALQARDWAFGTDAMEPKFLPGSDKLNPAYLKQVSTFASFGTVPRATRALWTTLGGKLVDDELVGHTAKLDRAQLDKMRKWVAEYSTVKAGIVDRLPMLQRERILIDLVRAGKDGASLAPYLDALERDIGTL